MIGATFVAGLIVRATWFRVLLGHRGNRPDSLCVAVRAVGNGARRLPGRHSPSSSMAAWRFAIAHRRPVDFIERNFAAVGLPDRLRTVADVVAATSDIVRPAFAWIVPLPISLAIVHLVAYEFPAATLGGQVISGLPYLSTEGLAAAAVIGGLLVTGMLASRPYLFGAAGLALAVLIYTLTFEVLAPFVMVPWGVATVTSVAIVRRLVVIEPLPSGAITLAALSERVPFAAAALGLLCMVIDGLLYAPPNEFFTVLAGLGTSPRDPVRRRADVCAGCARRDPWRHGFGLGWPDRRRPRSPGRRPVDRLAAAVRGPPGVRSRRLVRTCGWRLRPRPQVAGDPGADRCSVRRASRVRRTRGDRRRGASVATGRRRVDGRGRPADPDRRHRRAGLPGAGLRRRRPAASDRSAQPARRDRRGPAPALCRVGRASSTSSSGRSARDRSRTSSARRSWR